MGRWILALTLVSTVAGTCFAGSLLQGFEAGLGDWRVRPVAGNVTWGVITSIEWPVHSGNAAFKAGLASCSSGCLDSSVIALEIELHRMVESVSYWILEKNKAGFILGPFAGESTLVMADGKVVPNSAYYPAVLNTWSQATVPIDAYVGTLSLLFRDMTDSGYLFVDDISITLAPPEVTPGAAFEDAPVPRFFTGPGGGSVDALQLWMGCWANTVFGDGDAAVFDQAFLEWRPYGICEKTEKSWVTCLSEKEGGYVLPADFRVIAKELEDKPETLVLLRDQPGAGVFVFRTSLVCPQVHAGSGFCLPALHLLLLDR